MNPHWHKHPAFKGEELSLGDRAADWVRNGMGSWIFVGVFVLVLIAWTASNSLLFLKVKHGKPFDPYPYILLNLFLSMLAAVQGAILLISAKRADSIAARIALHTEKTAVDIKSLVEENTGLTREVKENTERIEEVHRHVTALTEHFNLTAGATPPVPVRRTRRARGSSTTDS